MFVSVFISSNYFEILSVDVKLVSLYKNAFFISEELGFSSARALVKIRVYNLYL